MSGDIKNDIIAAIAKTDDDNMKTVLLLLLAVVGQIGDKIDAMQRDEKGLRDAVLNGHEPVHHSHHEWVAKRIKQEEDDAAAEKDSKRKIRDDLVVKVLGFLVIGLLTASGWVLK